MIGYAELILIGLGLLGGLIAWSVKRLDKKFESIDRKFEAIDKSFDGLEERLNKRIDKLDEKITDIDRRVCRMEGSMAAKECCILSDNRQDKKTV